MSAPLRDGMHESVLYLSTSGNHWQVNVGHSKACVMTVSYRNIVFFFQIFNGQRRLDAHGQTRPRVLIPCIPRL